MHCLTQKHTYIYSLSIYVFLSQLLGNSAYNSCSLSCQTPAYVFRIVGKEMLLVQGWHELIN